MGRETQKICLDTDIAIEILKESDIGREFVDLASDGTGYISTVTVFELLLRKTNIEAAEAFIKRMNILDFDQDSAHKASLIKKELVRKGISIEIRDLFIAATVIVNNCQLATLNTKDFENVGGLSLLEI